jgi:LTXXQ motif family protein
MRPFALATAVATLATAAAAQQRPRQPAASQTAPAPQAAVPAPTPMGRGRMGGGPELGGLAGWLASNPAGLDLTADQLTRIRAARDQVVQANAPLRTRLQAAYGNRDVRSMNPTERRALMDSTRTIREQMRQNAEQGRSAVTGILTPAQQQSLDRIRPNWRNGGPAMNRPGGRGGRTMMRRGVGMSAAMRMRPGRAVRRGGWRGPGWGMAPRVAMRPGRLPYAMGPRLRMGFRMGFRAGMRGGRRAGAAWRGLPRI